MAYILGDVDCLCMVVDCLDMIWVELEREGYWLTRFCSLFVEYTWQCCLALDGNTLVQAHPTSLCTMGCDNTSDGTHPVKAGACSAHLRMSASLHVHTHTCTHKRIHTPTTHTHTSTHAYMHDARTYA